MAQCATSQELRNVQLQADNIQISLCLSLKLAAIQVHASFFFQLSVMINHNGYF